MHTNSNGNGLVDARACNCSVSFLSSSVPNLCLDGFAINLYAPRCKLNTNGGFRFQVEFIASESGEQVRLADTGVPNQDHYNNMVRTHDGLEMHVATKDRL